MKILISAYACEPDKGSEPEVGWQWVMHLAAHCDVTVLTRANNRDAIESKLQSLSGPCPVFVYLDLSTNMRRLKRVIRPQFVSVSWYYSMWQRRAKQEMAVLCAEQNFDLVHHLTIASFRLPFAVAALGVPCIVGPVGGCEDFPEELLPKGALKIRLKETLRNWMTRLHTRGWVGMRRYMHADKILASTQEMCQVFKKWGVDSMVVSQIGMPKQQEGIQREKLPNTEEQVRLLFVGGILYWKGVELALQALVKLPNNVTLHFLGSGADLSTLKAEVVRLGLENRVQFLGWVPRSEVLALYGEYDVFFYPSLHDSGAFTVIEAMAAGLPVICLDRGGPALSVTDVCGKVVTTGSRQNTIMGLIHAVEYYLQHPEMIVLHGSNGRKRIMSEYDWETKSREMLKLYESVIRKGSRDE